MWFSSGFGPHSCLCIALQGFSRPYISPVMMVAYWTPWNISVFMLFWCKKRPCPIHFPSLFPNGEVDQERLAVALKRVTKDSQRRVPWRPFLGPRRWTSQPWNPGDSQIFVLFFGRRMAWMALENMINTFFKHMINLCFHVDCGGDLSWFIP